MTLAKAVIFLGLFHMEFYILVIVIPFIVVLVIIVVGGDDSGDKSKYGNRTLKPEIRFLS